MTRDRLTVTTVFPPNAEDLKVRSAAPQDYVQCGEGLQSPREARVWKCVDLRLRSSWKKRNILLKLPEPLNPKQCLQIY